jgi:hypothetical protein
MKFVITEEQNINLHRFVISKFEKGNSPEEIYKLTGIPMGVIVDALMDVEIASGKEPTKRCELFYIELLDTLRTSNKLVTYFKYNDGREILLDYDTMSGSMTFDYGTEDSVRIYGYATPFYDGVCAIPVDVEEYTLGERWEEVHRFELIYTYDEAKNIRTYRDLIRFRNEDYFRLIKSTLDGFIDEVKSFI